MQNLDWIVGHIFLTGPLHKSFGLFRAPNHASTQCLKAIMVQNFKSSWLFRPNFEVFDPKHSLPAFTPSISRKTRGEGEKWLWYLDSAPLNYPGTDTLVFAFWLAETYVFLAFLPIPSQSIIFNINNRWLFTRLLHS
jgi:hypothetical protein